MKILKHYTIINFIEHSIALLILKSDYWEYSKDLYLIESCETFEMRVTMWQILNYWKRPYTYEVISLYHNYNFIRLKEATQSVNTIVGTSLASRKTARLNFARLNFARLFSQDFRCKTCKTNWLKNFIILVELGTFSQKKLKWD